MAEGGSSMNQVQAQVQTQTQVQTLSPQQVLEAKLLQLSTIELEDHVRAELADNPALEDLPQEYAPTQEENGSTQDSDYDNDSPYDAWTGEADDDNDGGQYSGRRGEIMPEIPIADNVSFYDLLSEQLAEQELDERQRKIAEYLIGSIDNDGFLDKDLQAVSDDLAFYHDLDADTEEIKKVLEIIQEFDPAGIGARNLQECLLLQLERKPDSKNIDLQKKIISGMFDEFTHKRWDRIAQRLGLDESATQNVIEELVRLNPRPGSALGEVIGHNRQVVVPDFILECFDDEIHFSLNTGNIPQLHVSQEYIDMLEVQSKGTSVNQRSAAIYLKRKIEAAKGFIEAIKQRHRTMTRTMQAIIDFQRSYFLGGDETLLKPMILKDISQKTGLDISTVSRVTSGKYVQTPYGTYPLKWFFTDGVTGKDGQEVSVRQIHHLLRQFTDNEDRHAPLSDGELVEMLKDRGFNLARRTIAKYRDQIGIPVARLRKE